MDGCFDELLTERVVAVGLGGGADPAGHAAAAHDGGGDTGDFVGPDFVVLADAQEQATVARAAEQIAVEQILLGRLYCYCYCSSECFSLWAARSLSLVCFSMFACGTRSGRW